MSKLYRWAITTREDNTYTPDEAQDDLEAALEQAGIDAPVVEWRGVQHEPAEGEAGQ